MDASTLTNTVIPLVKNGRVGERVGRLGLRGMQWRTLAGIVRTVLIRKQFSQ